MRKIISKSNSKAVRSMDAQVTTLFLSAWTQLSKISKSLFIFPLHLTYLKSICINSSPFILPFPMQPGQGTIPVDLIMSPLLAPSTFSLWLPPYRIARVATVDSHSKVSAPKEGSKHCRGTDCFRGTSYLYCQKFESH